MDESSLDIASLMRLIVFSKLLLLVDGLVIVVPNELWRPCPLLNLPDALSPVTPVAGVPPGLLAPPSEDCGSSGVVAPPEDPAEPMLARGSK